MSYCVNCGIELAPSEKSCPLCGTPVFNPRDPNPKRDYHPHPKKVEKIIKDADRKYMVTLATIFLLVPVAISLICDWALTGGITWSAFVFTSAIIAFIFMLLPLWFKNPAPIFCALVDSVTVIWFLYTLNKLTEGHWFASLALPISSAVCAAAIIFVFIHNYGHAGKLAKLAVMFFISGATLVAIELAINHAVLGRYTLNWSLYTLVPCIALGICSLIIQHRSNLKERIRRKLYF